VAKPTQRFVVMESIGQSKYAESTVRAEEYGHKPQRNSLAEEGHPEESSSTAEFVWNETKLFLELAMATSLMYMGFVACPLITASCVGRWFGPVYLIAFSLANLMGNLCTQTLVTGLLGAIDTLSPRALGRGDFEEVGNLAVRGFVVSIAIMIPVNVFLVLYLEDILVAFGEDHLAAHHANKWYNVFVLSLPFSILYQNLCKFLTVQKITAPVIWVSVLSTALIWPILEVCAGSNMGFIGTAFAYVFFWIFQSLVLLGYVLFLRPHDSRTMQLGGNRGGIARVWRASMEKKALKQFVVLGLGGVVAQCEWVFWEALGLVVGKLGIVTMTAHTIPTQIVMNTSMFPIAFGIALAVRMGISMPSSVKKARGIAMVVVGVSVVVFGISSVILYACRDFLIRVFVNPNDGGTGYDNNADVYSLVESIWSEVSFFNLNVALFGILAGISSGLGKQWVLGTINTFFLWVFGMPVIYYTAVIRENGGLEDAWFWMNVAYMGINGALIVVFVTADWYEIQETILCCNETKVDDNNDDQSLESEIVVNESTALLLASEPLS
jgi:Na+-driven multidrug efflux pump